MTPTYASLGFSFEMLTKTPRIWEATVKNVSAKIPDKTEVEFIAIYLPVGSMKGIGKRIAESRGD